MLLVSYRILFPTMNYIFPKLSIAEYEGENESKDIIIYIVLDR